MSVHATPEAFPREELLELLKRAKAMLASEADREALRASLHLPAGGGERQPETRPRGAEDGEATNEPLRPASARRFAVALVDEVSRPDHLDAAVTLARRAINAVGGTVEARWAALVATLEQLQIAQRSRSTEAGQAPDLETYRQWAGFECLHHYSLTDRFFGREDLLRGLDEWSDGDDDVSVQCLCALGGAGKSALAWRWVNGALTRLRQKGYRGVFWCSFYAKAFGFEDFMLQALAFCAQVEEGDLVALTRREVEARLVDVLRKERFLLVIDGLERLMTGYAQVADRAVDEEGERADRDLEHAPAADRRLTDPRNGAFLRRLADKLASRLLITTRLEPAELEDADGQGPRRHVGFMRVPGLDLLDSVALWESLAPTCPVGPELEAIFEVCGYHPLAISILARSVAASGGDWDAWRRRPAHAGFSPGGSVSRARAHIIGVCLRELSEESYDVLAVLTTSGKPMTLGELGEVLRQGSIASGEAGWTVAGRVEAELEQLVTRGFVGEATVEGDREYDVHPVVRGAVWSAMSDPRRERFIDHALSEFAATPDPQRALDPAALHKATTLYELLVKSEQWDRAWEMLSYRLAGPLSLQGATRELLDLFAMLLRGRDPLQLLPLTSRREQGNAAATLAFLLMNSGEGDDAETLLRWSGAIRLRINDALGFLETRHGRTWQTLYEGRLFETEAELRGLKLQALQWRALDAVAPIDCWIGIVLALRGEREHARRRFREADGGTSSFRWWAQGIAEGNVYLGQPEEALRWVGETSGATTAAPGDERHQTMWECLTRGMAFFARENFARADEELSFALRESRQTGYRIIECFALPYLAEIRLEAGRSQEAAELVDQYFQVDPDSRYRLAAADAWRVRALCAREAGHDQEARAHASRAYQEAACDGPPFVYAEALRRAADLLAELGGYVPRTRMPLPPDWREHIQVLEREEVKWLQAIRNPRLSRLRREARRRRETERALLEANLRHAASEEDQRWWDLVAGNSAVLTGALSETMDAMGIDIAALREAFEGSEHKSLEVVFYELDAARVIRPHQPRRFGDLDDAAAEAWLARADDHAAALDGFLQSDYGQQVAAPFELELDDKGADAFLADCRRRIGVVDAPARAQRWWLQLAERRPSRAMLVLAEAIQAVPAMLSEFVDAISVTGERGVEYAFYGLQVERAIARQHVDTLSKTEGWPLLNILLRLQAVKYQLGWADVGDQVRQFWLGMEHRDEQHASRLLQLAEELALRDSSIAEYYDAFLRSNTDNIQANLCYLDYSRLARTEWTGADWPHDISVRRWSYDTATPAFTETAEWSAEQLARRLEVVRDRVGYAEGTDTGAWWSSLEAKHPARTMIRLAEELDAREASIGELHLAHVDGGTDNLLAALAYLDFGRLRQFDASAASARAETYNLRGNAHYESEAYTEAIADYEAAIAADAKISVYYENLAGAWERVQDEPPSRRKANALAALERGLATCGANAQLEARISRIRRWQRVFGRRGGDDDGLALQRPVIIEISDALVPHADAFVKRSAGVRNGIYERFGVPIPGLLFRGNPNLPPGAYAFQFNEAPVAPGQCVLGHRFVPGADDYVLAGRDPADGRPGGWVAADAAPEGDAAPPEVEYVLSHLGGLLTDNLARFLNEQEVANELELSWATPLDPERDGDVLTGFTAAVKGLVDECVPVLDIDVLLDAFRAATAAGGDVDRAIEALRMLAHVRPSLPGNGPGASYLRLDPEFEREIRAGLRPLGREHVAILEAATSFRLFAALRAALADGCERYRQRTLVVADAAVRRYVRLIVKTEFPHLAVIAEPELAAVPDITEVVSPG